MSDANPALKKAEPFCPCCGRSRRHLEAVMDAAVRAVLPYSLVSWRWSRRAHPAETDCDVLFTAFTDAALIRTEFAAIMQDAGQ